MIIYGSIRHNFYHSYSIYDIFNSSISNMLSYSCYLQKVAHWPTIYFAMFAEICLIHILVSTYKGNMQMSLTFISLDFIYIRTLHIVYAIKIIMLFWNLIMHCTSNIWKSTMIIIGTNNTSILKIHRSTDIYVIHSK